MKKLKLGLLALATSIALVGCGSNSEDSTNNSNEQEKSQESVENEGEFSGKTLKIAGLDSGYGTEGWQKVIAEFEDMTGAKVEATFEKNIADVIRPEIQAGNTPDFIYNSVGTEKALTETMIKEDMVEDITDVLEKNVPGEDKKVNEKIIDGFTDTSLTNPYGDGKTYLAPLFYSPTGIWYNKDLFEGDDKKYDLPKTMDEFIALGEIAKDDGIALFTYPVSGYLDTFFYSMMYDIGGEELFTKLTNYDAKAWEDEATPLFENTGKILEYLNKDTVAQANHESFTQNQLQVMKNETLFMPNGNWIMEEMKDAEGAEGFEWAMMALPTMTEGEDRYAYSYFEQGFIPKDAKEKELAKEFVAFLYSDKAAKAFYENGGAVQPIEGATDLIDDEKTKKIYGIYDDENIKVAIGGWAAAPSVEGVDMHKALYDSVNSVANGEKTIKDWQKEVVDTAKKISEAKEK